MSIPGATRRAIVGVCAAMAVVAVGFATPSSAHEHHEGLIPEGHWTDEQIEFMLALIEETEEVLPATFPAQGTKAEIAAALEPLGFHDFGVTAPGGYDHWINASWLFDDHYVNPEFAESLVYQNIGGGQWQLVSAMFMLAPDETLDDIPEHLAALPGWHGHPELCTTDEGTFAGITDPDDPDCPPGSSQATTPLMMHVWIVDNECGHRFGGIGVGGLHCDVHHDHDDHDGDDHDDDHDDDDHGDDHDDDAPPADAVVREPSFTG
jgi:hypothetical protein